MIAVWIRFSIRDHIKSQFPFWGFYTSVGFPCRYLYLIGRFSGLNFATGISLMICCNIRDFVSFLQAEQDTGHKYPHGSHKPHQIQSGHIFHMDRLCGCHRVHPNRVVTGPEVALLIASSVRKDSRLLHIVDE